MAMTARNLLSFSLLLLLLGSSSSAVSIDSTHPAAGVDSPSLPLNHRENEEPRKLNKAYALYNLETFLVRFTTDYTSELEQAHSVASKSHQSKKDSSMGREWMLVSETLGFESSLSYPIRTATQEYLYLGFQNLIDAWLLELSGGPDGTNNENINVNNATNNSGDNFNDRLLRRLMESGKDTGDNILGQVYDIDGGDSTGEPDYNSNVERYRGNLTGTEIQIEFTEVDNHFSSPEEVDNNQRGEPQLENEIAETTTNESSTNQQESLPTESNAVPPTAENVSSVPQEEQQQQQQPSTPPQPAKESQETLPPSKLPPPPTNSNNYVDIYDGLVYNSIYDHLVTVDLRVKLYLRKSGYSNNEDSLRNRRDLQSSATGEAELIAQMTPTIAFLEPISEAKRLNKPSNEEVEKLFGMWMEYLFGKQKYIYLRALHDYEDQALLREISELSVDISSSYSSAASGGAWSQKTQNLLISAMALLGVIALIWPLFAWAKHVKKNREITAKLMNEDLNLSLEEAEGHGRQDSFGSVTYRDSIQNILKLPPINVSVPRPQNIMTRVSSLDTIRHGKDVFPTKRHSDSQTSAMNALEASDRYLSQHRPDLFVDQEQANNTKGTVNVFGRVYGIPSNPFDFIYRGGESSQNNPQQQQPPDTFMSPVNTSTDLGKNAHYPFASPRSSFTSVGGTGNNNSAGGAAAQPNHFKPIVTPDQNLAAGMSEDDYEDEPGRILSAVGNGGGAHTGHSWQNGQSSQQMHPSEGGSLIGNIFRNLSVSLGYNGVDINNSYTSNTNFDPEINTTASVGTEEVYYDDYHQQHQGPSLFQSEIELESLSNDNEDDPANYKFAFADFPRKDGTPCLIVDDDSFLSERKRRESANNIFNLDDHNNINDDGSISEKKTDDMPVSDEAFKMMLSQNALDIDNSVLRLDSSGDDSLALLEGSFLNQEPDAKSSEFQDKLSRLVETKRQRYAQEKKNEAILAANRKKRKNNRERDRVDRHKAIERELEDIEAEFSLTMQPLSPTRDSDNNNSGSSIQGRITPSHSPKQPTKGPRYSPMPSRNTIRAASPARRPIRGASPARKNIATLSPSRPNLSNIGAYSPTRSSMPPRGVGHPNSSHRRQNSLGASPYRKHRKQNSLGASPYRKPNLSPRTRYNSNYPGHRHSNSMGGQNDILSTSHRSDSPTEELSDLNGPMPAYKPKFRPMNAYGGDHQYPRPNSMAGAGEYDDLSLPVMTIEGGRDSKLMYDAAKFKSPQAVIDEAMQSGTAQPSMAQHHYPHKPIARHQRTLTPTKPLARHHRTLTPTRIKPTITSRRTNSFDVNDQLRIHRTGSSSSSSSQIPQHRQNSGGHHRRVNSHSMGGSGGHLRSNSRDNDMFLHGVVAQTRFI